MGEDAEEAGVAGLAAMLGFGLVLGLAVTADGAA